MLERIENVVTDENYGTHHPDSVFWYPEHLDHERSAFRHLDAKNYGAHHLDSVIKRTPGYKNLDCNAIFGVEGTAKMSVNAL